MATSHFCQKGSNVQEALNPPVPLYQVQEIQERFRDFEFMVVESEALWILGKGGRQLRSSAAIISTSKLERARRWVEGPDLRTDSGAANDWTVCTVGPACKFRGFVQEKLTLQEGFSSLTLEQGNIIMNMPVWV